MHPEPSEDEIAAASAEEQAALDAAAFNYLRNRVVELNIEVRRLRDRLSELGE